MNNVSRETLERLRESTFLSDEEWSDCLQLSPSRYHSLKAQNKIALSNQVLEDFSGLIDLTPEAIISGNIDFKTVAKRQNGHASFLPERYSVSAHSKIRTSSHLLDYIEIFHGWRARSRILRHFQLNESIFANLDREISIQFLADLCAHLSSMGIGLSDFYEIGKYSVVSNSNNAVGDLFRKTKDPKTAYEKCFTEIIGSYYDKNSIYTLKKLARFSCVLEAKPHPLVMDELREKNPGSAAACTSRGGGFASIMCYIGAPESVVKETTCIHRGDAFCTYEINFENAARTYTPH
jgi:hypothetical protein